MNRFTTTRLAKCIARYKASIPAMYELALKLMNHTSESPLPLRERDRVRGNADGASITDSPPPQPSPIKGEGENSLDSLIALYARCYPLLEQAMWSEGADFHALLADYQALFREQEALIAQRSNDDRHDFIIGIPIADRPPHLRACLESIHQVCQLYNYGGRTNGVWSKIKVVVAEDSRDENNIRRDIELVEEYRAKGLQVIHFGLDEQYELLHSLPADKREQLGHLLTAQPRERFYLKGQAANRNLSYLKFLQLTEDKAHTLYYLVDSDQGFCVNRQTESGEETVYALNYFHVIDGIFRNTDTLMLTGKIVGDPPVSPSVMTANFLDDVNAFFMRLASLANTQPCQFHGAQQKPGDAAYHDLAKLFGYEGVPTTFPYQCKLAGAHDHAACLADFASRINAFFFGEHLTRKTWFEYKGDFSLLSTARTIYPGNTIVNYAGLKYVIPFGHLRLRMSGPTAGRLIAAEIGPRFASFNMPNLHRRITEAGLADDFRPGVDMGHKDEAQRIDISNEFERQFFGDMMLFTAEELVKRADVNQPFVRDVVETVINKKESELLDLYRQKHAAIVQKNRLLNDLVFKAGHWWLDVPELTSSLNQVRTFIDNIDRNFGEHTPAWQQIQSAEHRTQRKQQIVEALLNYRSERDVWDSLF